MPNPTPRPTDRNPPPRRVFITGAGMISPMGNDAPAHLAALRAGSTHFREIDFFDVSRQRVKTAGVADPPAEAFALTPREAARLDRGTRLLLHATAHAHFIRPPHGNPPRRRPSFSALPQARCLSARPIIKAATAAPHGRRGQFARVEHYQPQRQAGAVQRALDFQARTQIISNACASGANAIGHAFHMIRNGREIHRLAGGYDALCQLVFAGFDSLQALAPSGIPRPFDAHRDGLALGEGAAMFVLESAESMAARGATPIAEICGYGMATDLHHLTQPHPRAPPRCAR